MVQKRILVILGWFTTGGIEAYLLNVLDHINREEYIIEVAVVKSGTYGAEKVLTDRDYRVIYLAAKGIHNQIAEMHDVLSTGHYDIVHVMQGYLAIEAHTVYSLACLAFRKRFEYKIINHAHGCEDLTRKNRPIKVFFRSIIRSFIRATNRMADACAACSGEAGLFFYGDKGGVAVLLNGIDIRKFSELKPTEDKSLWRERYGIPEDCLNFVIVARIADVKNPMFLIDILASLKRYYPNILLTWAGDGPQRDELGKRIQDNCLQDNVNLLGVQHRVQEILECCDYFILPSKTEGAGIAIVEAQAAGLKCFASDRVPNIIDCGSVSFISLDKSADQWADEIHTLIETNTKTDVDPALLQRFDICETVQELCKLYDSLLT